MLMRCPSIVLAVILAQTPAKVAPIVRFPANQATNVSPDTHLVLTFPQPPAVGRSGEIRVYDAADGSLVDRLDLSIPAGPSGRTARGDSPAGTPPPIYQQAVIGGAPTRRAPLP